MDVVEPRMEYVVGARLTLPHRARGECGASSRNVSNFDTSLSTNFAGGRIEELEGVISAKLCIPSLPSTCCTVEAVGVVPD